MKVTDKESETITNRTGASVQHITEQPTTTIIAVPKKEIGMTETIGQGKKMMEMTWDQWRKILADDPWAKEAENALLSWYIPWLSVARDVYDIHTTAWNTLRAQGDEFLQSVYRQSPLYSEALADEMKKLSEIAGEARESQQRILRDSFDKITGLVKERKANSI